MSMPEQKPGSSRQDWQTPPEFLDAVRMRLLIDEFILDAAATDANTVSGRWLTPEIDGLSQPWSFDHDPGWTWCNPPYSNLELWTAKAVAEAKQGANVAMLVPASVGANWWRDNVDPYAYKIFLNGRITFVGADAPYPKDCALLLYVPWVAKGWSTWSWRENE